MQGKKRILFITILLLVGLGSIRGLWSSNSLYGRDSKPKNLTDALEIIETKAGEGVVRVSFRNASRKNINGIQVAVNGSGFEVEFLDADEPKRRLRPGGTYQEWFPTSVTDTDVSVLAVVFEDGTGDGDSRLVNEVLETRQGVKKQLQRFDLILSQSLNSPNVDAKTLEKLNAELDKSIEDDPTDSGAIRLGQRKANQQIRHDLQELERRLNAESKGNVRNGLTLIQQRHANRVSEIK